MERRLIDDEKAKERVVSGTYLSVHKSSGEEPGTTKLVVPEGTPETIRLYIPDANNFGHQATCVTVLYRLMECGYNPIRVIYAAGQGSDPVWPKLAIMIPGLPEESVRRFVLMGFTLYFDEYSEQFAGLRHESSVGKINRDMNIVVTGAFDSPSECIRKTNVDIHLGARCFLVLQPCQWTSNKAVDAIYFRTQQLELKELLLSAPIKELDKEEDPRAFKVTLLRATRRNLES